MEMMATDGSGELYAFSSLAREECNDVTKKQRRALDGYSPKISRRSEGGVGTTLKKFCREGRADFCSSRDTDGNGLQAETQGVGKGQAWGTMLVGTSGQDIAVYSMNRRAPNNVRLDEYPVHMQCWGGGSKDAAGNEEAKSMGSISQSINLRGGEGSCQMVPEHGEDLQEKRQESSHMVSDAIGQYSAMAINAGNEMYQEGNVLQGELPNFYPQQGGSDDLKGVGPETVEPVAVDDQIGKEHRLSLRLFISRNYCEFQKMI